MRPLKRRTEEIMDKFKAPLGWNSWDCYGAAVDEDTVRKNAEFMAEHLKE